MEKVVVRQLFFEALIIAVSLLIFVNCTDNDPEPETLSAPVMEQIVYDATIGEVTIDWKSVANATGYMVYYSDDASVTDENYNLLGDGLFTGTSTTDNTIPIGVTRIYKIKAVAKNSESEFSDPVTISINNTGIDLIDNIWSEMIEVEGGTFTMGGVKTDEMPHHQVTLSTFKMMEFEMTQEIYEAIGFPNPSRDPQNPQAPVNQVSWDVVNDLIYFLNTLTNMNYRLPTEAEWEYAARGGRLDVDGDFPGFNDPDQIFEYIYRSDDGMTTTVGSKKPNELGLYDMGGNAAEWCYDYYSPDFYTADAVTNPTGPFAPTSEDNLHIQRGGGANHEAENEVTFLMVHERSSLPQNGTHKALGFRLVHSVK